MPVSTFISPAFVGQNGHGFFFIYTKEGAATTADLSQQKLHEEVVNSTTSLGHKPHSLQCLQGTKLRNWTPIQTLTARISWGDDWW
jgi:hypothetical protein